MAVFAIGWPIGTTGGRAPRRCRYRVLHTVASVGPYSFVNVAVPTTPVDGCLLPRPTEAGGDLVTFADHVAPILRKHCQVCHQPDTVAPFSLVSYDQVKAKGRTVAEAGQLLGGFLSLVKGEDGAALPEADRDRLLVMAGVSAFPMRVKCATLAWHAMNAALHHEPGAKTE